MVLMVVDLDARGCSCLPLGHTKGWMYWYINTKIIVSFLYLQNKTPMPEGLCLPPLCFIYNLVSFNSRCDFGSLENKTPYRFLRGIVLQTPCFRNPLLCLAPQQILDLPLAIKSYVLSCNSRHVITV